MRKATCQESDGVTRMNFDDVPYRRELDRDDLDRMRIPERYWGAKFDLLSEEGGDKSVKSMIASYIGKMSDMRRAGWGFVFYGKNGRGKSAGSVVLAKEFRRRGFTVLFVEAADLKRQVIEREHFDEDETYWERATSVDVLVVDDFGKGIQDSTGFGASLFDELIRSRNARKKITIITANLPPSKWKGKLELKESTMDTLKECTIPVLVTGDNHRVRSGNEMRELLAAN